MRAEPWSVRFGEVGYPTTLASCPDAPRILFGCGTLSNRRAVAIVGSRAATREGSERARGVAMRLASAGFVIVSGGAIGIDAAAHRGALDAGGETIAVLGSALDDLYPARNRELLAHIAERGALLTPFDRGQPIRGWNFPHRNKIIAGLSEAVIVVEAGARSGSLSTAAAALRYGRKVMAFAGSVGTQRLLSQGAHGLGAPEDLPAALEESARAPVRALPVDEMQRLLLNVIDAEPRPLDEVAHLTRLPLSRVSAALLALELEGRVFRASRGYVRATSAGRART